MAIPENITAKHIMKAISVIKKDGIPVFRKSYKYYVNHDQQLYPPKYLISLANLFANGELLNPSPKVFNTYMAQSYLIKLDFKIVTLNAKQKNTLG